MVILVLKMVNDVLSQKAVIVVMVVVEMVMVVTVIQNVKCKMGNV